MRLFDNDPYQEQNSSSTKQWPSVLCAAVEGKADMALSSLGAALFYLQRSLIDEEILSMGNIKAYIPPASSAAASKSSTLNLLAHQNSIDSMETPGISEPVHPLVGQDREESESHPVTDFGSYASMNEKDHIMHMSIDGNTLCQLEILTNSVTHQVAGSLWSKINFTMTPHGA